MVVVILGGLVGVVLVRGVGVLAPKMGSVLSVVTTSSKRKYISYPNLNNISH